VLERVFLVLMVETRLFSKEPRQTLRRGLKQIKQEAVMQNAQLILQIDLGRLGSLRAKDVLQDDS
jgi:hypothetical protein